MQSENVFVLMSTVGFSREAKPQLVLADFDTARILTGKERSNSCIGTPYIMAPEVFNAINQPYTFSADSKNLFKVNVCVFL